MSTKPMKRVGAMASAVKTPRNGLRRPVRSLMAPSTGDTAALMSTEALTAKVNQNWPPASPRNRIAHRLIAKLTIAKRRSCWRSRRGPRRGPRARSRSGSGRPVRATTRSVRGWSRGRRWANHARIITTLYPSPRRIANLGRQEVILVHGPHPAAPERACARAAPDRHLCRGRSLRLSVPSLAADRGAGDRDRDQRLGRRRWRDADPGRLGDRRVGGAACRGAHRRPLRERGDNDAGGLPGPRWQRRLARLPGHGQSEPRSRRGRLRRNEDPDLRRYRGDRPAEQRRDDDHGRGLPRQGGRGGGQRRRAAGRRGGAPGRRPDVGHRHPAGLSRVQRQDRARPLPGRGDQPAHRAAHPPRRIRHPGRRGACPW